MFVWILTVFEPFIPVRPRPSARHTRGNHHRKMVLVLNGKVVIPALLLRFAPRLSIHTSGSHHVRSPLSPARRGGVAILVVLSCENAKMVTPARPSALSPARRGGVAILVVLGCENAKMVTPARPSALSPARRGGVAILVVLGCENAKNGDSRASLRPFSRQTRGSRHFGGFGL